MDIDNVVGYVMRLLLFTLIVVCIIIIILAPFIYIIEKINK